MSSKLKNVSAALAGVICFVLVICASLLSNKTIDAVYKGKVTSFDTAIDSETGATVFDIYFELASGHTSAVTFYCLNAVVDDCYKTWGDAVQDGKNNGYREFINSTRHSPWTKDKVSTYVEKGLVTDDRPYLRLFSNILLGVFVLLLVMAIWPIKSQEINHG